MRSCKTKVWRRSVLALPDAAAGGAAAVSDPAHKQQQHELQYQYQHVCKHIPISFSPGLMTKTKRLVDGRLWRPSTTRTKPRYVPHRLDSTPVLC